MQRIVNTAVVTALLFVVTPLAGCGENTPSDQGGPAAAQSAEERLKKARDLFVSAQSAAKPTKIDLYEQVIGLYPESPYAEDAHFRLINVLVDASIGRHDDALEQTRSFAERHPTSAKVAEAWRWMANHWSGDAGPAKGVRDEWRGYLKKTRERDDLTPEVKAFVWLQSSYAAVWDGDKAGGAAFLEEALPWTIENKRTELEIAFRAGSLQQDLGNPEKARAAFGKALRLAKAGARGPTPEVIQSALDAIK